MEYWDIKKILPYQRNFNFINGVRSIGKTYGTMKYFLSESIKKGKEFVYIVRTQHALKGGAFEAAFRKVIQEQFNEYDISFSNNICTWKIDDENRQILGYCLAISDYVAIKRRSFPNVRYIMFDEYMLEGAETRRYIQGWKEPDLFLSIYHSIDRERDAVICFLLGNTTTFFNPYHMHKAFNIPSVKPGEIWYSENVLFQWAIPSEPLREEKAHSRFGKMIEGTRYGDYANMGVYVDDNFNFIEPRTRTAKHYFTFVYNGNTFGVWADMKNGKLYIDFKYDPSCLLNYALTTEDHRENTLISKGNYSMLKWLAKNYKLGNVRYVNMQVKALSEDGIKILL